MQLMKPHRESFYIQSDSRDVKGRKYLLVVEAKESKHISVCHQRWREGSKTAFADLEHSQLFVVGRNVTRLSVHNIRQACQPLGTGYQGRELNADYRAVDMETSCSTCLLEWMVMWIKNATVLRLDDRNFWKEKLVICLQTSELFLLSSFWKPFQVKLRGIEMYISLFSRSHHFR